MKRSSIWRRFGGESVAAVLEAMHTTAPVGKEDYFLYPGSIWPAPVG